MLDGNGNPVPLPLSPDADAFWIYLIAGIVILIGVVFVLCLNGKGYPRRWLAKRLGIEPMD